MNAKQEQILALITKKKKCDQRALEIVHKLIEPKVDSDFLLSQAVYIGPPHLEDVVEERRISGLCGWALCTKSLDPEVSTKKQRYVIRGKKVLDITDRKSFCSSSCYAKSTHFKKQLLISPLWMREEEKELTNVTFQILDEDTELHGAIVNLTGLKLTDEDKESANDGGSGTSEDEDDVDDDKLS